MTYKKYRNVFNLSLCSLLALCPFSNSEALITNTNEFSHAFSYHLEDVLYVFDLDNTLIQTAQHLGSDEWFFHHMTHLIENEGLSKHDALSQTLSLYLQVQNKTEIRLVDASASELLSAMKQKKASMIGLTKRDPKLACRTLEQLASLQIDFSSTSPIKEDFVFKELADTVFKNGVVFVGKGIEKGPVLIAYLKKLKKMPKRVIAIDDRLSNVENMGAAVESLGIDYIGVRYGKTDEKVKSFNPKIANIQLAHFEKILSDEQALHLLKLEN